jgi:hypothetical protein
MSGNKVGSFENGECVAPVGLTLSRSLKRLLELPEDMRKSDPEHIIMGLWAKENTRDASLSFGLVPIDNILHECNGDCGKARSYSGGPSHHYVPPSEEQVKIINATIQWLATNCGRCFLNNFLRELKNLEKTEAATPAT